MKTLKLRRWLSRQKWLLCRYEDLSSNPKDPCEKRGVCGTACLRKDDCNGLMATSLAPSSVETLSQKIRQRLVSRTLNIFLWSLHTHVHIKHTHTLCLSSSLLGSVAHASNSNFRESQAEGFLGVWCKPEVHSEFQASQHYRMRACLKKRREKDSQSVYNAIGFSTREMLPNCSLWLLLLETSKGKGGGL